MALVYSLSLLAAGGHREGIEIGEDFVERSKDREFGWGDFETILRSHKVGQRVKHCIGPRDQQASAVEH